MRLLSHLCLQGHTALLGVEIVELQKAAHRVDYSLHLLPSKHTILLLLWGEQTAPAQQESESVDSGYFLDTDR